MSSLKAQTGEPIHTGPKTGTLITPQSTALDILKAIETWAGQVRDQAEPRHLWAVLSALRGPDVRDSDPAKQETTIYIRAVALPTLAALAHADLPYAEYHGAWSTKSKLAELGAWRGVDRHLDRHFGGHIRTAANSLLSMIVAADAARDASFPPVDVNPATDSTGL